MRDHWPTWFRRAVEAISLSGRQSLDAANSGVIAAPGTTFTGDWVLTREVGIVRLLTVLASTVPSGLGATFVFEFSEDGVTPTIMETRPIGDFSTVREFDLINAGAYYRVSLVLSRPLVGGELVFVSTTLRRQNDGAFVRLAGQEIEEQNAAFPQTFAYLKAFDEMTGKSVNLRPNEVGILLTADFLTEVAKGNVSRHRLIQQVGANPDADAAASETVWSTGAPYAYPTVAAVVSLVSTSVLDTAAGTGARTIRLEGLDGVCAEISETVALNGLAPVSTVATFLRVHRFFVATAGVLDANQGVIVGTVGALSLATIPVGTATMPAENGSLTAVRTIPAGHTGYLLAVSFLAQQNTASATAVGFLRIREPGGVFRTRDCYQAGATSSGSVVRYHSPISVPAQSDVQVDCAVSNNNTQVSARMDLLLVANT
jgi:hypothetical protein